MLIAISGKEDTGKTLVAIKKLYEGYELNFPIWSNIHLSFPHKRLYSIEELKKIKNSLILLDELWESADSRKSGSEMNLAFSRYSNQHRKRNVNIYYTTQDFFQMDLRIRKNTDILYLPEIKKYKKNNVVYKIVKVEAYKRKNNELLALKGFAFVGNRYYKLYNTYEYVEPLTIYADGCNSEKEHKKHSEKEDN